MNDEHYDYDDDEYDDELVTIFYREMIAVEMVLWSQTARWKLFQIPLIHQKFPEINPKL